MIDTVTQFALGYIIGLSGALIPGPLLTFIIAHTLKYEKRETGLIAGLGHCIVEAFIIIAIILGLTAIFEYNIFQLVVNLIGGTALIIFGFLNIITIKKRQISSADNRIDSNSLIGGIFFTIFNATIPLWWTTVGLTMLNQALKTTTMFGVTLWVLGHWSADLSWFSFIGYSVAKGKNHVGKKAHFFIILLCGVVLISMGTVFVGFAFKNFFYTPNSLHV